MYGYAGKILEINLNENKVSTFDLDEKTAKEYVGGAGLGAALYAKNNQGKKIADIGALSPDNTLIFATGPLTSSPIPAASRFSVCGRSPLTNAWGEANSGGFFANEFKKAGFDAMVIKGASPKPVYIEIYNDDVKIQPADDLWGKDTYQVTDSLKDKGRTLTIGQAGENMSLLANIAVGKHNFFGRAGMGALMGSKKLKAVVVKGSAYKYSAAEPEKLKEMKTDMVKIQKEHPFSSGLSAVGSISGVEAGKDVGDLPTKNWQLGAFPGAEKIGATHMAEHYSVGAATCWGCPVACKREVAVKEGPYQLDQCPGPEYETAAAFGSMLMIDKQDFILKANNLCNRYGLDTMTTGATIAFAIECFEKGYLTTKDTGGIKLNWSDPDTVLKLLKQIAHLEGFGAELAQGIDKLASRLDPAVRDFVTTVKGFPAAFHDPRLVWALGLDYATGSVGASHVTSHTLFSQLGIASLPEVTGGPPTSPPPSTEGKAEWVKKCQDFSAVSATSASVCEFGGIGYNATHTLEAINAATGFNYTMDSMMETGERIFILKRCLSNIWGIRKKDDTLPKRLRTSVQGGPTEGLVPPIDQLVEEYYPLRGLKENGCVKEEVMKRLDIPQNIVEEVSALH